MPNSLAEQHQSVRHREPLQSNQFHQDTRSVRVRTGEHKPEYDSVQGQYVEAIRSLRVHNVDEDRKHEDGNAAYDEAEGIGLGDVHPGQITHPAEADLKEKNL